MHERSSIGSKSDGKGPSMYGSWHNGIDGDNKGGAIKTRLRPVVCIHKSYSVTAGFIHGLYCPTQAN